MILDASALLALIFDEPGGEQVLPHARGSAILSVNYAEAVGRVRAIRGDAQTLDRAMDRLEIAVAPFDRSLARRAGELREQTDPIGASLADRACLAYALQEGLPVLTADRDWAKLDLGIDVRQIR